MPTYIGDQGTAIGSAFISIAAKLPESVNLSTIYSLMSLLVDGLVYDSRAV